MSRDPRPAGPRERLCACEIPDPVMQADRRFYCHRCSFPVTAVLCHRCQAIVVAEAPRVEPPANDPTACDCWDVHANLNLTADTCGCNCHGPNLANQVRVEPPPRAAIEQLALEYHKVHEGEYGCPGLSCPGVQRLIVFGEACATSRLPAAPVPAAGEEP